MRGGFRPALAVQIGSLAGDGVWAILGLAAVAFLGQLELLRRPIGIAGAAYLCWLAWEAWQASTHTAPAVAATDDARQAALRSGALLSLTNPQNVGYWAALGTALGGLGVRDPQLREYSIFFAGFMLSSIVWSFLFAAMVHWLLANRSARWARITYRVCALMFAALAVASLRQL